MKPMFSLLHTHADELAASTAGLGVTAHLAATQPVDPSNYWSLLNLLPALLGPALAVMAGRHLAARAARKRAKAEFLKAEGLALQSDANPANDAEARAKLLEAAELNAEAEAMDRRGE
jgi:hypothetical protein